jgi:hypothetical protein
MQQAAIQIGSAQPGIERYGSIVIRQGGIPPPGCGSRTRFFGAGWSTWGTVGGVRHVFGGAAAVILGLFAVLILEDGMSEWPRVIHIGYFIWLASLVWLAGAGLVNWSRHGPRRLDAS